MKEKHANNQLRIYLLIPIYWVTVLLWQVFRPVANRSFIDVAFKLLFLISIVSYIIIKSLYNKVNLNKLFILFLYIISQIITLSLNHDITNITCLVDPVFSIILSFVFFILISDYKIDTSQMIIYSKIMIGIVLILCFYADVFQFNKIMNALHTTSAYSNAVSSFVKSNHEFGLYLCFGIASCVFCIMNKPVRKIIYYILIGLFSFNILLTFSRTSLLSIVISGVLVIFMRKKHLLLFFLSVIVMSLIVVFNPQINNFVFNIILRLNHDAGRSRLITGGIKIFLSGSIPEMVFGIGYSSTGEAAKNIIGNHSFHNAYIMILLDGGIIMMLFFLLIVVTSIINSIKCIKLNRNAGIYMLMTIIIALLYMCAQTPIIFCSDLLSFMITSFTFIIPKYYYNSIISQKKMKWQANSLAKNEIADHIES